MINNAENEDDFWRAAWDHCANPTSQLRKDRTRLLAACKTAVAFMQGGPEPWRQFEAEVELLCAIQEVDGND